MPLPVVLLRPIDPMQSDVTVELISSFCLVFNECSCYWKKGRTRESFCIGHFRAPHMQFPFMHWSISRNKCIIHTKYGLDCRIMVIMHYHAQVIDRSGRENSTLVRGTVPATCILTSKRTTVFIIPS